jgi:hypothetical protein
VLPASMSTANVRFRFRDTSGEMTNNFYLDDFNVSGLLSLEESAFSRNEAEVFPNPIIDVANVKVYVKEPAMVSLDLLDITGRQLASIYEGLQSVSGQTYALKRQDLSTGIYLLRVTIGNETTFQKLVME